MKNSRKLVLAAAILLMPGGFVMGGALLAKHIADRKRQTRRDDDVGAER